MKVREIAHCRAGDKGNISNVSVIAYKEEDYDFLKEHLDVDVVRKAYGDIIQGKVERYELPKISALNFVLFDALGGGVTTALNLDIHGKSLSSIMLNIDLVDR
ncbi:AtuA-related protein [Effusibacillus dendaii]|uniref:AtuA-like ferredoxin-fold domain-containing protein n=1 Tax=Effusibacillus dendaii TaxID=2743772 RepID=A0A7I8DD83_9BACL|nr:hypothetical protein [Effusibacillus dendaii]BCJ86909.1 hypothetical protein skT53_18940 [Effusibacillus dendaii]